jgi:beta-lactamase regulating signal transducer with metallopeptidase domain
MERTGLESFALDYLANSIWQVPLLAAGAWLAVRAVRPGPRVRHAVWLAALMLAVAMPLRQVRPAPVVTAPVAILPPFTTAEPQPFSDATIAAPAANPNQSAPALWKSTASSADAAPEEVLLPTLASGEAPHPRTSPHAPAWLHLREVQLSPAATRALLGLYLLAFAFALGRLLGSWRAARRMVAEAEPALLTASEIEILDSCCEHFNVPSPRVCMSTRASSPVVIGVFNPVLLMPTRFAPHGDSSFTNILPHELEAVWWHELAHVRRRDYLANLACRVLALPVAYHPAVWAIGRRVRQTREMVCDAMAAEAMQSPVGYARCLVGLAQRMSVAPAIPLQGTGMFDGGVLEERVMELIQKKATVSVRMRGLRLAGGMVMALAVLTAVSAFHVTPTQAQAAPPAMVTELASPFDAPPSSASAPIPNAIAPQAGAAMSAQAAPAPAATAPEAPGQEDASRPSVYARVPVAGTYVDAMAIGPRRPVSIAYADSNGTGILVELLTKTSGVDFVPYVKGVAEDIHTKLLGTLPPRSGRRRRRHHQRGGGDPPRRLHRHRSAPERVHHGQRRSAGHSALRQLGAPDRHQHRPLSRPPRGIPRRRHPDPLHPLQ